MKPSGIGPRIQKRLQRLGMTQTDLSAAMQARGHDRLVRQRISDLIRGQFWLRHSEVPDMARVLRCPVWWLLGIERQEALAMDILWKE